MYYNHIGPKKPIEKFFLRSSEIENDEIMQHSHIFLVKKTEILHNICIIIKNVIKNDK